MRVALFSGNYNYVTDGANRALNRLVGYLERQGVEVRVYSPTSKTPAFEPAGTLVSARSVAFPGRGEYRLGFPLSRRMKADIAAFHPDVFHLSAPDWLGHSALNYAEQLGRPAVASFHTRFDTYLQHYGLSVLEGLCRRQMRRFYDRCAHVYVPTPQTVEVLQADGVIGDNVRYWSRGVDRDAFSPAHRDMDWRRGQGVADNEAVLAFVGRLVKEKGVSVFIDTVKALQVRGLSVRAMVAGDGPERGEVQARLPGELILGHQSGEDLARAYASADLFINPSQTETFGNVTLEAMASGVPAICANATGGASLVKPGVTGFLVDQPTVIALSEVVLGLCTDASWRDALGRNARKASAAYDWDEILAEVLAGYHEALGTPAPLGTDHPVAA